jgi:prephenate dehydrogenase
MDNQLSEEKQSIAIIGTGLIGCSMADGLRDTVKEIIGVDNNTGHLQEALYRGWIDKSMPLKKAVSRAGVIIVSVPVDATIRLLPLILDNAGPQAVVIDAGSVKAAICRSVKDHPKRAQFIAAHPMAGLALSGPDASDARLFRDRKVIICEHEKSSEKALNKASGIFNRLGLNIIYMEPDLHDLCVAQVSHLPQVIAYCLSALTGNTQAKKESMINIASTGFESTTRLSSSPANMWLPIIQHNRDNLSVCLDEMIGSLSDVRDMINQGRWKPLEKLIENANKSREIFLSASKQA